MPLHFKMGKRTGGYKLNQDLYVIHVYLLDGGTLQCTLSTNSTGRDCMNYICQRMDLHQNVYFGLRYKCTKMVYRWIDLNKPLKKQLTKNAQEMKLYFGVMFHTLRPDLLTDEVAKYFYYLQMRADILDGRLLGSPEKAILCASYSLQVEFSDYDLHKQTADVLKNFTLLPTHMTSSAQILEGFVKQVILAHEKLRGLPQSQAVLAYIQEAQGFDGYGEEYFSGRNEDGEQIFVGYCMNGIIVKQLQGPPDQYSWKVIQSIIAQKNKLLINCAELNRVQFQMEDIDTAKYAAFICGLQLEFHKEFLSTINNSLSSSNLNVESTMPTSFDSPQSISMQTVYSDTNNGDYFSHQSHHIQPSLNQRINEIKTNFERINDENEIKAADVEITKQNLPDNNNFSTYTLSRQANNINVAENESEFESSYTKSSHTIISPPAYRAAPDYESALRQPSLESFNRLMKDTVNERQIPISGGFPFKNGSLAYSTSFQYQLSPFLAQSVLTNENYNVFAYSNPEINFQQHLPMNQVLKPYRPPPVYSRICASSPDLSNIAMCKSMSTPDLFGKRVLPKLHPIDITLEDLAPRAVNDFIAVKQQQQLMTRLQNNGIDELEPVTNHFNRFFPNATPPAPITNFNPVMIDSQNEPMLNNGQQRLGSSNNENFQFYAKTSDDRLFNMEKSLYDLEYLYHEYESVPKKRASAGMSTAQRPEHCDRNNDPNYLPYEDTRVSLASSKRNPFGYINASFIKISLANVFCFYVATQTPTVKTAPDFWQMVWETGCLIIVALENSNETYLPSTMKQKIKFNDFQVHVQSNNSNLKNSRLITTIVVVKHLPSGMKRSIYHLNFLEWSKNVATGKSDMLLNCLDEVKSVQRLLQENEQKNYELAQQERQGKNGSPANRSSNSSGSGRSFGTNQRKTSSTISKDSPIAIKQERPPIVVHCNSGSDRSGVYILVELMINCLECNENLDVPKALTLLRQQRMNMVSSFDHYKFVYLCLIDYLKNSRLI